MAKGIKNMRNMNIYKKNVNWPYLFINIDFRFRKKYKYLHGN